MSKLARQEEDATIQERVNNLQRAVASTEKALACASNNADAQLISENLADLKDTLDIAGIFLPLYE